MMTPQERAAKTRRQNRDNRRMYEEVSRPAHQKVEAVLNGLLLSHDVRLNWAGNRRLKNGVKEARLVRIDHGGLGFTVQIDGYKTEKKYSSRFWEVVG